MIQKIDWSDIGMNYKKRLDHAFANAPILPITPHTQYVFFSDCHRGVGNNNDNFLKNTNSYFAALQYYYQYGFSYIEVGDGDELWENCTMSQITEIHGDVFCQLCRFHEVGRLFMLYGNHDMVKKYPATSSKTADIPRDCYNTFCQNQASILKDFLRDMPVYEGIILRSAAPAINLYVTHGHQADLFNSVFWKLSRFLVRHLWSPLEAFGFLDPTSAAKNNTKKEKLEKRYIDYALHTDCYLLTGHTHRPTLGTDSSPYCNCGSCVHPRCITCIELCGYRMNLVKWYSSTEKSEHFGNIYAQCPPSFPVYIKREVLSAISLL